MIPLSVLRYLPYVALGLGALVFAWLIRFAVKRAGVLRRPVLFAAMILGALPALYVGLTWVGLLSDDYLRIARPWVTLLALAATSFIAIRLAAHRTRQEPWRAHLGDLLASAAAFAAAMAASGPEIGRPLDRLTVLIAVDRSRSIDLVPNAEKRVAQELSIAEIGMREDDRIATIVFGAEAATEDPPRPKSELGAPQRVSVGRDGTDISAGIRRSLAEVPSDSAARIVLLTDGVATRGDTMAAAAAAVASELPVDVVPLEQRVVPDIRVVAFRAPSRADEGEAIDLRLVTSSPAPAEIEVRLSRDGEPIAKAIAKIAAGEDVLRIREKAPGAGLHRYDVAITALDPRLDQAPEDNSGSAFVRVRGQAVALVLEGDAGKGAFIAKSLEDAAFRVTQGSTSSVPADLGGFAGYDVVVLSDIRASDLSPGQLDAIGSYVRDLGGGLILMGGDRGMGPGGYARTAVEEVSPLSFDLKQERRRASLAEVIGIDISGSMAAHAGPNTKLELANEAAARSASLLGAGDMLGVEHVDTVVKWSVPLGPVVNKAAIDKAIRSVGPGGGGILVDITLEAAYAELSKVKVNLKHMILFADGSDAEDMGPKVHTMVADALRRGITTTVVALGNGSDVPELETLSRLGGGRFYLIEDAQRLPAVFAQETILAARSAIVEKSFSVGKGTSSAITAGVALEEAPDLGGYVVTIPKSRASVLLTGPDKDPILAVWSAGIGRSAAFTSDLKDRWGAAWTRWPGAARLIAQTARDVARKGEDTRVRLEADASGGELHVRASVVGDDGRAQSFRRLIVHVAGPEGFARELPLEPSGAGAYTATLPLSRPGTFITVARDELSGEAVGTTGAVLTAGEELRPTGSDLALLGRIVELTGGKKRDTLAGIFGDRASKRFSYKDSTPPLILIAAFGLLLAVAARRLAAPEALVAWAAKLSSRIRDRSSEAAPAGAGAGAGAGTNAPLPTSTVDALLQAKERARVSRASPAVTTGVGASPSPSTPSGLPARPASPRPAPSGAVPPRAPSGIAPGRGSGSVTKDSAPPSQGRPLTAAEILLARRKGKRV
jgi:Ca-activated chloride channel family protein